MQHKALPGNLSARDRLDRMIRVNHAGEYGAKRIYAGQLAVLGKSDCAPLLKHMAAQEEVHLATFATMLVQRKVRPTALMPLWHVGGFALGALTALMGKEAAMACTAAVEEVIDQHYADQEQVLDESESELKATIQQFRAEEKEHHDTALAEGAERAPFYRALHGAIALNTKFAIWLSTRI
ncbi:MAG: demethoxyubiquinone hydroxylase family protein [Rickettsiales bacterium]|nr:demethoxyubiquinone hydroxylase family protein [Rickettsiales bacterium]